MWCLTSSRKSELDLGSDLPELTKTIKVEITHPAGFSEMRTELFGKLAKHGIKSKVVK